MFVIVYIDYNATIQILRQTTLIIFSINKLNLRLVKISQYLFSFSLSIHYKSRKFNVILDILFRLQLDVLLFKKLDILKLLYSYLIDLYKSDVATRAIVILLKQTLIYYIILIEITNKLKQRLKIIYVNNYYWNKILNITKEIF